MKKTLFNKIIIILMMVAWIAVPLSSCSGQESPESKLLESTRDYASEEFSDTSPLFLEVTVDGEDIYTFNFGGYILKAQFTKDLQSLDTSKFKTSEVKDKKLIKLIKSSRKKVTNYIATSIVLENKEELIEQVNALPVLYLDNREDFPSLPGDAMYYEGCLYITDSKGICEWMFCHEFVHYLRELTSGTTEPSMFDEGMTDVITASMKPATPSDFMSTYQALHPYLNYYLGIFQEEGLHDFFYGYTEGKGVLSIATPTEHAAFICMLDHLEQEELFYYMMSSMLYQWDTRFSA